MNERARRSLSFASLDDVLADAERCAELDLPTTGGWSLGQILEHLATTIDKSLEGFSKKPAFIFRLMSVTFGKMIARRFIKKGIPPGFQLKGNMADELLPEPVSTSQGLEHLRQSIQRYQAEDQRMPHPGFGKMTDELWTGIHLRHAELHLSFAQQEE